MALPMPRLAPVTMATLLAGVIGSPPIVVRAAEDAPGEVAGVVVALAGEDAVDEDGFDAMGALNQALAAAGEVVDELAGAVAHAGGVEEDNVGGLAGEEAAA